MFNMLRMDMRRMLRSKSFYICLILLGVTMIFVQLLVWLSSDPQMVEYLNSKGILLTISNEEISSLKNLYILDMFQQANISGGLFAVVSGILASIFVLSDFESGYVKNILAVCVNRWKYLGSKFLCISLVNLIFLIVTFLISIVVNVMTGSFFLMNGVTDIIYFLTKIWALECGFTALILLACMLTRSKAGTITVAIFTCGGVVGMVLNSVLGIFGLNKIMQYTLYMNVAYASTLYEGINSLKPIGIGAAFVVIYMVLSQLILSKRDI